MNRPLSKESVEKYLFQQSETGQATMKVVEAMKRRYVDELHIPISAIKTGKLTPLKSKTGEIKMFIEE